MIRKKTQGNVQSGFVVVIAMIGLMAMTFFLVTGIATTSSTVKVSGNYSKTVDTFNLAELGLAKARPMLENQDFSTILATYSSTYLISPTAFTKGTYEVIVADDAKETDSNPLADTNSIIRVVSTGRNNQGGKVTIETHLQLISGADPISFPPAPGSCASPPCNSSVLMCGTQSDIKVQGSAFVDGADYPIPTFGCTGVGCNTTPDPTTTGNWDIIGQGTVTLDGSGTKLQNTGTASNCDQWQTFYNQWASVSSSAPGVVLLNGSEYSGDNSCATPKIYLINTSEPTLRITGNTYLCGMFIVASNTTVEMSGTVTLVGVFMMMGNYSNVTFTGTSGTSNFAGKVIFNSTAVDSQKELYVKGNAKVMFSTQGMNYGLQAINNANAGGGAGGTGSLLTAAWEESY